MADDKVSERDLDRALRPVERAIDSLATTMSDHSKMMQESIAKQQEFNTGMSTTVATLGEQMRDSREDVQGMSHLLRGNGTPGLTTDVRLLSDRVQRLGDEVVANETKQTEKTKGQKALLITLGTGAIAGLGTLLTEIVQALM